MSREGIRKLLGGYATGTLTAEEQQVLFEAALEDQELFDELAREQSLRDLLRDPAARASLLAALGGARAPWHQRLGRWMWGHAVGLSAVACFLVMFGYVARMVKFAPERVVVVATEPTTVEVNGSAGNKDKPNRVFDLKRAQKAAEQAALEIPPPPAIAQRMPEPRLPLPAYTPVIPAPPAVRMAAVAGARGGSGGGGARQLSQAFGIADAGGSNTTGALAGTIIDSSAAGVQGAQVLVRSAVTGATRSTVTTPEGIFRFSGLEPARYSVTVTAPGFARADVASVDVTPSAVQDVGRIALNVGSVSTDVQVTASATPVGTSSSENSKLADSDQMVNLSLKGRDLFAVLQTTPGVYFGNAYLTGGDAVAELHVENGRIEPGLVAAVRRARGGARPTAEESRFVSGGQAYVRLTLTNASAETLGQLKGAGLVVTGQQRNEVAGHVPLEKLEALARFPFVVWIAGK